MRRALLRLAGRGSGAAARGVQAGEEACWVHDAKALKEAHIALARERVFGPQGNLPGDRYWRKRLEGRELMRWYFPSKYNLQDFRVDDYFEMQAERFAPREAHGCMPALTEMLEKVSEHREALRSFFGTLDEPAFLHSPTLQDLYGLFRLVDPDPALPFAPPPPAFREHSPLFGARPPFRAFSSGGAAEEGEELHALHLALKERLGAEAASALEARLARLRSPEAVREVLLAEAGKLNAMVPFDRLTVAVEELEAEAEAAAAAAAAAHGQQPGYQPEAEVEGASVGAVASAPGTDAEEPSLGGPMAGAPEPASPAVKRGEEEGGKEERKEEGREERKDEGKEEGKEEQADPFSGLLGTWAYAESDTFEVSRGEGGHLWLVGQLGTEVSGELQPSEGVLLCELRRTGDGVHMGHARLRPGNGPGTALLTFRKAATKPWLKEVPAQLLQAAMPSHVAAVEAEAMPPSGEAEAEAAAALQAEATEEIAQGTESEDEGDQDAMHLFGSPSSLAKDAEPPAVRLRLQAYAARAVPAGPAGQLAVEEEKANAEAALAKLRSKGPPAFRRYLARRHRFIDPMYRRRRLKWIERTIAGKNGETELKFNSYYTVHPDEQADWPMNKGSVTVVWPSPYH